MKKVFIDFHVTLLPDPRVMVIADTSVWSHIENKPSIIEIILPGEETPITHYFKKGQLNVFNSINLMVNCGLPCGCKSLTQNPLPDGIYTITVKGSPSKFNKTIKYLRTTQTRLELDKLFLAEQIKCKDLSHFNRSRIDEIDFLLRAAEANTRLNQIQDAQELFFKAQGLMEKNCY